MTISYHGQDNFSIKTKGKTIEIGQKISLGGKEIISPGEYEAGGIELEIIDGIIEIYSEKMTIAWIKKGKVFSDEELEKLNGINVLLIGVGGGEFTETKTAVEVINQIEPAIVIPMYKNDLESFLKEEGISPTGLDQWKFSQGDLPQDERKVVVLNVTR